MGKLWITGEALIDFVPVEAAAGTAFLPREGGSTYNVAKAAARQGAEVAFVGPLSTDLFGDMLASDLAGEGVELARAPRLDAATPLAFVRYQGPDARYAFFDRASTMAQARYDRVALPVAPGDIVHAGSISLISEPGAGRLEAMMLGLAGKAMLSLDPNARPSMMRDRAGWRARIDRLAEVATILRLSDEDLAVWRPEAGEEALMTERLAAGTALVVVTRGAEGASAATPSARVSLPARLGGLVDTVGAGDTVMGTLLAGIAAMGLSGPDQIAALGADALAALLERALTAAWLNCRAAGCQPPDNAALTAALSG